MENWQESIYLKASDEAAKFKYEEKHTLTDGSRLPDPYRLLEASWDDVAFLPDIQWGYTLCQKSFHPPVLFIFQTR